MGRLSGEARSFHEKNAEKCSHSSHWMRWRRGGVGGRNDEKGGEDEAEHSTLDLRSRSYDDDSDRLKRVLVMFQLRKQSTREVLVFCCLLFIWVFLIVYHLPFDNPLISSSAFTSLNLARMRVKDLTLI